jgi:hypothetical protein
MPLIKIFSEEAGNNLPASLKRKLKLFAKNKLNDK